MNESDEATQVLCYCSGTTVAQIKALVAEGVVNSERISRITGAGSGCGACEPDLEKLLAESN